MTHQDPFVPQCFGPVVELDDSWDFMLCTVDDVAAVDIVPADDLAVTASEPLPGAVEPPISRARSMLGDPGREFDV